MKKFLSKQFGIGLLELMLSLAIIAILLVMATRYYSATTKTQRIDDTIQLIGELETAINTAITNDGLAYADVTVKKLTDGGYLSKGRTSGTGDTIAVKNPWSGTVTITGASTGVTAAFANVPSQQCIDLKKKFFGDSPATDPCSSGDPATFTYVIK